MEAHYHTQRGAPIVIGGLPDDAAMETKFALKIPNGLSLLIGHSFETEVAGLDKVPRDEWPNVRLVHWSFDVMVGCGMAMLVVAVWAAIVRWRKGGLLESKRLIYAFVLAGPLGFIAIETGWMVTELGRQPWIIYRVLRTSAAVTPMPGLVVPFTLFTAVYLFLSVVLVFLLGRQFR